MLIEINVEVKEELRSQWRPHFTLCLLSNIIFMALVGMCAFTASKYLKIYLILILKTDELNSVLKIKRIFWLVVCIWEHFIYGVYSGPFARAHNENENYKEEIRKTSLCSRKTILVVLLSNIALIWTIFNEIPINIGDTTKLFAMQCTITGVTTLHCKILHYCIESIPILSINTSRKWQKIGE